MEEINCIGILILQMNVDIRLIQGDWYCMIISHGFDLFLLNILGFLPYDMCITPLFSCKRGNSFLGPESHFPSKGKYGSSVLERTTEDLDHIDYSSVIARSGPNEIPGDATRRFPSVSQNDVDGFVALDSAITFPVVLLFLFLFLVRMDSPARRRVSPVW